MPQVMVQCNRCQRIFNSGLLIVTGSSNITLKNNKSQCPFCGSMENIPDGIFIATVDGFVDILRGSKNPLQEAFNIYKGLREIESLDDLSKIPYGDKIKQFFKKNEVKIAVGIAIIQVIINLLNSQPNLEISNNKINIININKEFYNEYNEIIIFELE